MGVLDDMAERRRTMYSFGLADGPPGLSPEKEGEMEFKIWGMSEEEWLRLSEDERQRVEQEYRKKLRDSTLFGDIKGRPRVGDKLPPPRDVKREPKHAAVMSELASLEDAILGLEQLVGDLCPEGQRGTSGSPGFSPEVFALSAFLSAAPIRVASLRNRVHEAVEKLREGLL